MRAALGQTATGPIAPASRKQLFAEYMDKICVDENAVCDRPEGFPRCRQGQRGARRIFKAAPSLIRYSCSHARKERISSDLRIRSLAMPPQDESPYTGFSVSTQHQDR